MIGALVAQHPQVKVVATTLREVHSTSRHGWSAVAWVNGERLLAPTAELDVYDRVGGGDGFASGFFYGLLAGETPEQALKLAGFLRGDGRPAEAEPLLRESLGAFESLGVFDNPNMIEAERDLADLLLEGGRSGEAEALLARGLDRAPAIRSRTPRRSSWRTTAGAPRSAARMTAARSARVTIRRMVSGGGAGGGAMRARPSSAATSRSVDRGSAAGGRAPATPAARAIPGSRWNTPTRRPASSSSRAPASRNARYRMRRARSAASTDRKVSLEAALRDFGVPV